MRPEQWIEHLERLAGPVSGTLPPDPTLASGTRGEQLLWRACAEEPATGAAVRATEDAVDALLGARTGPLLAPDAYLAIEVWAECELSAVHALHRLVRLAGGERRITRARRLSEAIAWHLEHTQPDNSTNRPWALHAFLLADDGSGEAALYAETLLGNMRATEARDEPLSRWILADAARELRIAVSGPG
jgi:hypothetical protein